MLFVAEVVEVGVKGVGGDLARASNVDGLDRAGVEELVKLGSADTEGLGGFADGVDEAVGLGGGGRGRAPSVSGVGVFVRADVRGGCGSTRAGAGERTDVRCGRGRSVSRGRGLSIGRG